MGGGCPVTHFSAIVEQISQDESSPTREITQLFFELGQYFDTDQPSYATAIASQKPATTFRQQFGMKAHSPDPALDSCTCDGASRQGGEISRKDATTPRLRRKRNGIRDGWCGRSSS